MRSRVVWIIIAILAFGAFAIEFPHIVSHLMVDDHGYADFCGEMKVIEADFRSFFKKSTDYPAYTLQQLNEKGAFNQTSWYALNAYRMLYVPFSSKTPDDRVVMKIGYDPSPLLPWAYDFTFTKADLTRDWDAIVMKQGREFEELRSKQEQEFRRLHPANKIISSAGTWKGRGDKAAGLITIFYRQAADASVHEYRYELSYNKDDWRIQSSHLLR